MERWAFLPVVNRRLLLRVVRVFSGVLGGFVLAAYALRPDALAAATIFPAWLWLLPGLALAGRPGRGRRGASVLWALWGVFALVAVDEIRPLSHPMAWLATPRPDAKPAGVWRVVSLNCAGGDPRAAAEVAAWQPDLILLQEAPPEKELRALARRLFGAERAAVVGMDTAVLARDPVPLTIDRRTAGARVRLPSGQEIVVVSVRLNPTLLRADLWSPECWRAFADDRRARRSELNAIVAKLPPAATSPALLIGGDVNAPAGDGIFSELAAHGLRDAFRVAGTGWGNTIGNDLPIHRIDQIWARGLDLRSLRAVRTRHSDHRMLIADSDARYLSPQPPSRVRASPLRGAPAPGRGR